MEPLSVRIRREREKLKLSQEGLAAKVRVSRVAVTKWESGQTQNLKLANLVRLCEVFKLTADELLSSELQGLAAYRPEREQARCVSAMEPGVVTDLHTRRPVFAVESERLYLALSEAGRAMVDTQLTIALEMARRMHGERGDRGEVSESTA